MKCPGSFLNPTTIPQRLLDEGALLCSLSFWFSGRFRSKGSGGQGMVCREVRFLIQLPEGQVGGGGLPLQPGQAGPQGPEYHSPSPRPPGPAPPSLALQAPQSQIASQGAEGVFLPGGQSVSGVFGRGLNTLSTLARPGSWTDTSALSHATR